MLQMDSQLAGTQAMNADPFRAEPDQRGLSGPSLTHAVVGSQGEAIGNVTLHHLEGLDDAVFEALAGDPDALDDAARRWRDAVRRVTPKLLAESRRQYARRARSTWGYAQQALAERLPLAHAALEILGLVDAQLDAPIDEGQRERRPR